MLAAKLTDKGQLVIPKPIFDALCLGPGSELLVTLEGGGWCSSLCG
jgi:AbrB family looped-hinge helix DNA binding protein